MDKLRLKYTQFLVGTFIWFILLIIGLSLSIIPDNYLPSIFSLFKDIVFFFLILPFGILIDNIWGVLIPIVYLFIFINFIVLFIKRKNERWMNLLFLFSTILIIILFIIGIFKMVSHP